MMGEIEEWLKILAKDPAWKKTALRLLSAVAEEKEIKNEIQKLKLTAMRGAARATSTGGNKRG